MTPKLQQMYREAKQVHGLFFTDLSGIKEHFDDPQTKVVDKIDTVHTLKQVSGLLDDIRKEIDKLNKSLQVHTALAMYSAEVDSVKTSFCSAKIDVKQFASYPHKRRADPEQFDKIMGALGVPKELTDRGEDSEVVRLNWEGFCQYFSERQGTGKPLLEGIETDKVYTEYTIKTRKRKEVDDNDNN